LDFPHSVAVPQSLREGVSGACLDFMGRLLAMPEQRVGDIEEAASHPWFYGIDWASLRTLDSPHGGVVGDLDDLAELLRDADTADPRFPHLVSEVTRNFEPFGQDGGMPRAASPHSSLNGSLGGRHRRSIDQFVGYTYNGPPIAGGQGGARPALNARTFVF